MGAIACCVESREHASPARPEKSHSKAKFLIQTKYIDSENVAIFGQPIIELVNMDEAILHKFNN